MSAPAQHRDSAVATVAFLIRYWLGCLLLWVSSGCITLVRIVAPVPDGTRHRYR
jgi:hypothetical protein